jgi:hypothetical protein
MEEQKMKSKDQKTPIKYRQTINVTEAELSLQFFVKIQEGKFIISSMDTPDCQQIFAETASPKIGRWQQWSRIRAAGANNKMCMVFDSEEAAENYSRLLTLEDIDSMSKFDNAKAILVTTNMVY